MDRLHDDQTVLVVDETGDVKKGTDTARRRQSHLRLLFVSL
ncbi:hypothetical protein ABZT27_31370 [Streptomyces sp. NPDC005389]